MNKTLESIFIQQYEDLQNELALLKKENEELRNKDKEDKIEKCEESVVIKTFSKECCYLKVASSYEIGESSSIKDLTSSEVKEIIDDEEKIKEYAKKYNDRYSYNYGHFIDLETKAFPYTSVIQNKVILLEVYDGYRSVEANVYVLGDKNELKESKYFDIKEKDRLYKYGLECFKKELMKVYETKLRKEQE